MLDLLEKLLKTSNYKGDNKDGMRQIKCQASSKIKITQVVPLHHSNLSPPRIERNCFYKKNARNKLGFFS